MSKNYWVEKLEEKHIRIPKWFDSFFFQRKAYDFRLKEGRFYNNEERILSVLEEFGSFFETKELATKTGIHYKNIGRYLKELEKKGKIKRIEIQMGNKRFIQTFSNKAYKRMKKIAKGEINE